MKKYIVLLSLTVFLVSCGSPESEIVKDTIIPKPIEVSSGKTTKETEKIPVVQSSWDTEEKFRSTMEEIMKKGTANTCKFTMTEEWQVMNGIFYVESGKMRYSMDFEVMGQKMTNDVIVMDNYSYAWSNMMPGKWMKMKESPDNSNDLAWNEMEAEERNKTMEFSCKKWVPSGIFNLPTGIIFEETSSPM